MFAAAGFALLHMVFTAIGCYKPALTQATWRTPMTTSRGEALDDVDPADGLPVSEAGDWASEKHKQLEHYIFATRHAREKWPSRGYFDLFSGPARQRVKGSGSLIDGSPLVAWRTTCRDMKGRFNHVLLSDAHQGYAKAAEQRLKALNAPVRALCAEASAAATWAVKELDHSGLHLVFADPYNLRDLPWQTLLTLTELPHVDFIVHFSTNDLTRHLDLYYSQEQSVLDTFAPGWKEHVELGEPVQMRGRILDYWISLMTDRGFKAAPRMPLVRTKRNVPLYRLVFFSREKFPAQMWNAIDKPDQGEMPF